jgi:hypothetical protein
MPIGTIPIYRQLFDFLAWLLSRSECAEAGAFFGRPAKCGVAHTSLLIGRGSLLFVESYRIRGAVVRRSSYFSPAQAGLFCARPGNAKGPVIRDGAFRTFLRWRGMLCDPADFLNSSRSHLVPGPPGGVLRRRFARQKDAPARRGACRGFEGDIPLMVGFRPTLATYTCRLTATLNSAGRRGTSSGRMTTVGHDQPPCVSAARFQRSAQAPVGRSVGWQG